MKFKLCSPIIAMLLTSGCASTFSGQPGERLSGSANSQTLEVMVIDARLSKSSVLEALTAPTTEKRDQIIFARIAEIDSLYNLYETQLLAESRKGGFILSVAGMMAGLAGGAVTGGTSQIYSLIGAGIAGTQSAYDREVLAERTIQAFVAQMRAGRATVKTRIFANLSKPTEAYPIEAALSDLAQYRQAGTLSTAIVGITETAADSERQATASSNVAASAYYTRITTPVNKTPLTDKIRDYMNQGAEHLQNFNTCYAEKIDPLPAGQRPEFPWQFFTNSGLYPGIDEKMRDCLNEKYSSNIT